MVKIFHHILQGCKKVVKTFHHAKYRIKPAKSRVHGVSIFDIGEFGQQRAKGVPPRTFDQSAGVVTLRPKLTQLYAGTFRVPVMKLNTAARASLFLENRN